jgi:nucleotide-binding universal stress UspA family protein
VSGRGHFRSSLCAADAVYAHILVPLDNSPVDEAILQHIRLLARLTGARLTLIHVADGFVARNQQRLKLDESEEMRDDRAYLDRRVAELAAEGFQVAAILECGEPADRILALAEEQHCDLIAMSTHGHGFFSDLVLGSVADKVRHRTNIPVLLIRAPRA